MPFPFTPLHAVLAISITAVACIAVFAIAAPTAFARFAKQSSRWIDTSQFLARLDRPIDIDDHVLPHCRVLGVAVLASLFSLAYVVAR